MMEVNHEDAEAKEHKGMGKDAKFNLAAALLAARRKNVADIEQLLCACRPTRDEWRTLMFAAGPFGCDLRDKLQAARGYPSQVMIMACRFEINDWAMQRCGYDGLRDPRPTDRYVLDVASGGQRVPVAMWLGAVPFDSLADLHPGSRDTLLHALDVATATIKVGNQSVVRTAFELIWPGDEQWQAQKMEDEQA